MLNTRIQQRLTSGELDIFIRGNSLTEVGINSGCGGAPENNLVVIPDGAVVTLRHSKAIKRVIIRQVDAGDCVANSMEISKVLARSLRLKSTGRYVATYDAVRKTLTFRRKRVTSVNLVLSNGPKLPRGSVAIGDGIAVAMGNYLLGGELLTVKHGSVRLRLRYFRLTQNDIFNNNFRLNPFTINQLGLKAGTTYRVSYNQSTREINFIR